jgi:Protein of unknown function (DUF4089)
MSHSRHASTEVSQNIDAEEYGKTLDALLSASVAIFEIPIEQEWRQEARFFLGVVSDAARLVMSAGLGDAAEPAAVYEP